MDGLTLLAKARAAGLRVESRGDRLLVRGPRGAEPLAKALLAAKVEVLAALRAEVICCATPRCASGKPVHVFPGSGRAWCEAHLLMVALNMRSHAPATEGRTRPERQVLGDDRVLLAAIRERAEAHEAAGLPAAAAERRAIREITGTDPAALPFWCTVPDCGSLDGRPGIVETYTPAGAPRCRKHTGGGGTR